MSNTAFWARLLGLYALIVSIWCFYNANDLPSFLTDLSNNPLMLLNFGVFTLLLGLGVIVSHSEFNGWPIIVTIAGYWIALKGIILLFFPHWINHVIAFWQNQNIMLVPLPAFLIGLLLLYCGFVRKY